MDKIQLITYSPIEFKNYNKKVDVKDFNTLLAFDNYKINVIDLSTPKIWTNKEKNENKPSLNSNLSSDFISINKMIKNSKKSKIIICLPQNIYYTYQYFDEHHSKQLKDMIPTFIKLLSQLIPVDGLDIVYENNYTIIGLEPINSSFYFNNNQFKTLTISKDSEKNTTVACDNIIITSLDIIKSENLNILTSFLSTIGLINNEIEYPDWLYKYNFNDDEIQNEKIEQAKATIKFQKEIIENSKQKLQENLHYKSILYTNSNELVRVVFEILEYIFKISLSEFNDEKKEDFLFKKNGTTFIGEIKGVTSNVKYENISQLEVHFSRYLDKLQEENRHEKIKKVLIMNYERTKDIMLRDKINKMQVDLACKNGTLIIDTKTLLTIYEQMLQGKINSDNVIKYIENNSGIIDIKKINNI